MSNRNLWNKYYEEKHFIKAGEPAEKFDVVIDEKKCSAFREKGILCEKCFNEAVIEKMQEFSSLDRLPFLNYQLNKYSDPLDWLKRTHALLNDNEESFRSFNYKIYLEFQQMIEGGITQLSDSSQKKKKKTTTDNSTFVNPDRIEELRSLEQDKFDFCKLIAYCEEVNICYANECYLSVAMLTRAIIDHVPPVFDTTNFQNVYGQYGSKSFKEQMTHLDKSLRKIADSYLHSHVRNKETLPNNTQVNFSQDLDVLLSEICRKMK
jgi:hypothetical protein